MGQPIRIPLDEAHEAITSGNALFVSVYEDDLFNKNYLAGSISIDEFRDKLEDLDEDQQVIFYCDCENEEAAAEWAKQMRDKGYDEARALEGGISGWESEYGEAEPLGA